MAFVQKVKEFFIQGDLKEAAQRFPLSIACTAICFLIGLILIHDFMDLNKAIIGRLIVSCIVGFFWFTAAQLYRENHKISNLTFLFLSLGGLVFLVTLIFWGDSGVEFSVRFLSIILSLFLLVTVVPYAFFKSDDLSYWSYNRKVSFGISVSFVASIVLFLGASAALASLKYLFEVRISGDFYSTLWLFCATILGPVYALCFIPRIFKEEPQDCTMPTQVGFMANWILAPLVAVYIAILYAYFVKIGLTGEVPKGQLSYMIAGFATAGIFTYLVSWPFVYDGKANKLLTTLMKWFFPLLIIPVLVQLYAIFLRIDQYGVTEKRYIVLVMALWFAFLAIGFTVKKLQLKHIILSLVAILFLSSWGPWGMTSVSHWSQTGRLEQILTQYNLLKDGKIQKAESTESVPFEARKNISSIAGYLDNRDNADDVLYGYSNRDDFFEALGFEYVNKYQNNQLQRQIENGTFNFRFYRSTYGEVINMNDVDYYVGNLSAYDKSEKKYKLNTDAEMISKFEEGRLIVTFPNKGQASADLSDVVKKLLKENPTRERSKEEVDVVMKGEAFTLRLRLSHISGNMEDGAPVVSNVGGQAFITLR